MYMHMCMYNVNNIYMYMCMYDVDITCTNVMCTHIITYMSKIFIVPPRYYPGKDESLDSTGKNHSHAVVMALVENLKGRGHHIIIHRQLLH